MEEHRGRLAQARSRPAMQIGPQPTAHLFALEEPLRLVWKANAFQRPDRATVRVSPHQFQVAIAAGPVVPDLQTIYPVAREGPIDLNWTATTRRLQAESMASTRANEERPKWKSALLSASGPYLNSPSFASVLARRFAIAIRYDEGLWCQAYETGWPIASPLLECSYGIAGLVVVADLTPEWFTGLPFTRESTMRLTRSYPGVECNWADVDEAVDVGALSIERALELLQP